MRRYLGSFPSLNLHDPQIYVADLCTLLCGYPLWASEKAISAVQDTLKWPATRADLKPVLEEKVRVHRYADEWEKRADKMLEDRRLTLEAPDNSAKREAIATAWLNRTDPKARQLAGIMDSEKAKRDEITKDKLMAANKLAFERECAAFGIKGSDVSPALLKSLQAETEETP